MGNLDENDQIIEEHQPKRISIANANAIWRSDGQFNPLRSSWSMLRAVELPLKGTGGETEFIDARAAYDDLPVNLKTKIESLVGMNNIQARV